VLRHLLAELDAPGVDRKLAQPDPAIVFSFDENCLENGMLAR
jgi:hypothetical protein